MSSERVVMLVCLVIRSISLYTNDARACTRVIHEFVVGPSHPEGL